MGNPNHDPKTGEFSEGAGGGAGGSGNLHGVAKQTGLNVTREGAQPSGNSFEFHMAEVQKNLDAVSASQKAGESGRQKFNAAAQKLFGSKTKVRL